MRDLARHASFVLIAIASLAVAACTPAAASPSPVGSPDGEPPSPTASPGASGSAASGDGDAIRVGRAFVEALAGGATAAAEAMEDATMRGAAPASALGQLWGQVVGQFGAYGGIGDISTAVAGEFVNVTVVTRFANATVPLLVTVTGAGEVAGLHLGQPVPTASGPAASSGATPSDAASPAAYVDPAAFTETEVTVGTDPWALPGTLSLPAGHGPFPAVVLVAGSGPQDRDETIGPNKPLRDLAWGLASNAIAVLRYEKRTKAHGAEFAAQAATFTVKEETVDDAVAAVDVLRATPGIDPARVVVAGHSLGAYLAPRIAAQAPGRIAGIVLLEGSISPLQRIIEDQLTYLASEAGGAEPQAKAMLAPLAAQVALVESPDLAPSTPASKLPGSIPAAYWLDLRTYDPGAVARSLSIPMLIVQGGRDYQVPPSELALWRQALAGHDGVTFSEHAALNHLLMAGDGPSRPAEYAVAGHVDAAVIADLVDWVAALP